VSFAQLPTLTLWYTLTNFDAATQDVTARLFYVAASAGGPA
jgi:hypothetical protein